MDRLEPCRRWWPLKLVAEVPEEEPVALAAGPLPGDLRRLVDAGFTHLASAPEEGAANAAPMAAMWAEARRAPDAVVIGGGHRARGVVASLERMCLRLATGFHIPEPHSPYRVYPLGPLCRLEQTRGLAMPEVELLTHLAWGGVPVRTVSLPGRVAPAGSRPGWQEVRMLRRHVRLLLRRLLPWPHPKLQDRPVAERLIPWHPIRLLRQMLQEYASPLDLAIASFVGVFMGALPLIACHTVAILYVTTRFRLNRGMAIAMQNLCAPPVVPVLCIEVGYFLRHGNWLLEANRQTLFLDLHERVWEWFLGSLIVGPALGFVSGMVVFGVAKAIARRSPGEPAGPRIGDRRRGNVAGYWSFTVFLRLFGRRGAYTLLAFVVSYYVLFDRLVRRSTLPYLRRRFPGRTGLRRAADIYRLVYNQGVSLIDRYRLMTKPEDFKQRITGYESVRPLIDDRSRGFVLLVSHVGNWQALMVALRRMDRKVSLLMRPEDNPAVTRYLKFHEEAGGMRFVSPDSPMGGVIELTSRFQQGDIIAIMGDRAYGARSLPVEFLGGTAQFPCGPFQLAAAWECPIVVMLPAKVGVDEYAVDIAEVLQVERVGARLENLRRAMQIYADRLQDYAEQHPFQVYIFEDVWQTGDVKGPGSPPPAREPS